MRHRERGEGHRDEQSDKKKQYAEYVDCASCEHKEKYFETYALGDARTFLERLDGTERAVNDCKHRKEKDARHCEGGGNREQDQYERREAKRPVAGEERANPDDCSSNQKGCDNCCHHERVEYARAHVFPKRARMPQVSNLQLIHIVVRLQIKRDGAHAHKHADDYAHERAESSRRAFVERTS